MALLAIPSFTLGAPTPALAQTEQSTQPDLENEQPEETIETVTTSARTDPGEELLRPGSASSTVTREELEERLPRSAPDALRYEPGVFVQQTAHGQGSAFIRGRTGQQTILAFDGVRLNNSLFRQGPNQYFFTIDARSIQRIEIERGSASTRYGTDAIAGAINAVPLQPRLDPLLEGLHLKPQLLYRTHTADGEQGGRLQLDSQLTQNLSLLAGLGARRVGLLESGGPVFNPLDGELPQVPRFEQDQRTQLGTGFDELTADLRALLRLSPALSLTFAAYTYRQFDAPRTDQCPPAYAPFDECLNYDEQFRDLAYASIQGRWGPLAHRSRLIVSMQRQHEQRSYDRPGARAINRGQDDVTTTGLRWFALSRDVKPHSALRLRLRHGFDVYRDAVTSTAETELLNLNRTFEASRGQYLSGSSYLWGGLWAEPEMTIAQRVVLRAGARASLIRVSAPADQESGTLGVQNSWTPRVGNLGVELWASPYLTLLLNANQGFRAPNLDDLTSRQRTGPGFQIENPALRPERGATYEAGARYTKPRLELSAWIYRSTLNDAMIRTTRDTDACPPQTAACRATWARLQLVNLPGQAVILGGEASARLDLTSALTLAATLAYARGEGPTPRVQADDATRIEEARSPLSRIPPLNGTAELRWRAPRGFYLGGATRWARRQDRLALSDISDERIPLGGTPGFWVLDARAGWRESAHSGLHIVFENLTDNAYRYHGSSTNGAGRSLTLQAELGW